MNVLEKTLEEIKEVEKEYVMEHEVLFALGAIGMATKISNIIRYYMDEKEKVSSAEIISRDIDGKPYYEIKYRKVGEDHYTVGYSSYKLDYVVNWLNEYFEFCGKAKVVVNDGQIPVEEMLPEETGYYLVQLSRKLPNEDYSDRVVALYDGEEKEFMCYGNLIIAWKLLPEQYKPKETQAAGMEHIMSRFTKAE